MLPAVSASSRASYRIELEFLRLLRYPKPPVQPTIMEPEERNLCGEMSVVNADLQCVVAARDCVGERLNSAHD
jgi:hypothetical protein